MSKHLRAYHSARVKHAQKVLKMATSEAIHLERAVRQARTDLKRAKAKIIGKTLHRKVVTTKRRRRRATNPKRRKGRDSRGRFV